MARFLTRPHVVYVPDTVSRYSAEMAHGLGQCEYKCEHSARIRFDHRDLGRGKPDEVHEEIREDAPDDRGGSDYEEIFLFAFDFD